MAIYKTISSQEILRKVMRDLAPQDSNWMYDAVEWIGEALEHIGASAQLESKTCILNVKNHKSSLPADLYYLEQVGLNQSAEVAVLESQLNALRTDILNLRTTYESVGSGINQTLSELEAGVISSSLTQQDLKTYSNLKKSSDADLNKLLASAQVVYNGYVDFGNEDMTILDVCKSTFKPSDDCPECKDNKSVCYFTEADMIKTSFATGKVCLAYKAFPTDHDCYPLVPDSISFKEAMFWYIFKKLLLRGMESPNGFDYMSANQQWQYYCSQARNEAVFPDIPQMESFMNQWVRLVPHINRSENHFEDQGQREDLYRGSYNTYGR
jgi:hypothetical protein